MLIISTGDWEVVNAFTTQRNSSQRGTQSRTQIKEIEGVMEVIVRHHEAAQVVPEVCLRSQPQQTIHQITLRVRVQTAQKQHRYD